MTKPTPSTLTLLFKNSTTTLLLHATKDQPISSIKASLLSALQSVSPDSTLHGNPIPSSPEDIELALPVDSKDQSQGWTSLDSTDEISLDGSADESSKTTNGTGKRKGRPRKELSGVKEDCPASLELRDGSVLAFRFRTDSEEGWRVEVAAFEEEEGEGLGVEVGG